MMLRLSRRTAAFLSALVLAFALAGAPGVVQASPLSDAKAAGHVGERTDGYLGLVGNPPADVRALVQDINSKRRAHYQGIAAKTGTSLQNVGLLAGAKAIQRAAPGTYVMDASGAWTRK